MRWLIVEDALRDKKGHWFEYLGTFDRELRALGDDVTILADHSAEPFVIEQLQARPVLPDSIWRRMNDKTGLLGRYLRVPVHGWNTYRAVRNYLRNGEKYDIIFVPTVLVHHLLGWVWLIKRTLKNTQGRVLLFFPNTPIQLDKKTHGVSWLPTPTAKLFNRLIRSLRKEVAQGRVILGAETNPMREALTRLTGVPFTYFPHPVQGTGNQISDRRPPASNSFMPDSLTFAFFGSARHEKGSDVLVAAVNEFCLRYPDSPVRFVLQSVSGDAQLWSRLKGDPRIHLIPNHFAVGEYAKYLEQTDAMLLPYRRSSYGLRVSRVVIEAMVNGIPVIVTRETTLEEQARDFGAPIFCEEENIDSLIRAIREMERNFTAMRQTAESKKSIAQDHFSVEHFRRLLTIDRNLPTGKRIAPVLVTGSPRSGKSWLAGCLLESNQFWLVHQPFSNYRRPIYRSKLIPALEYAYTCVNQTNEALFKEDVAALFDYPEYCSRLAMDRGGSSKEWLKYLLKLSLARSKSTKGTLIDCPFLLFSADWIHARFDARVIIMIRNPAAFVADYKEIFNFRQLLMQEQLMTGKLKDFAEEIENMTRQKDISPIVSKAFLWKLVYHCVDVYRHQFPNWIFLRFEDIAANPVKELNSLFEKLPIIADSGYEKRLVHLLRQTDPLTKSVAAAGMKAWEYPIQHKLVDYKNVLSGQDIKLIHQITASVAERFYKESEWM